MQAATSPAPNSPPPTTPSPPTVATTAPTVSVSSAGFSGSVTPNGLATQALFEYGLDPKYTGGGPVVYEQSTPAQSVGSDFASHTVGPVAVSGLLPNALYHVRLVATNSDGTTLGLTRRSRRRRRRRRPPRRSGGLQYRPRSAESS